MKALGRNGRINVTAYDPDIVTEANVGRQMFLECDLGRNKAEALIERMNSNIPALKWDAVNGKYVTYVPPDIIVSCVDTRKARRDIVKQRGVRTSYYIDCGNLADVGQVIIGDGSEEMPWPEIALPALVADGEEDNTPSCSLAEALNKQDLFVNDFAATYAAGLLWNLMRNGGLDSRGVYFNLSPFRTNPIPLLKTTKIVTSLGKRK